MANSQPISDPIAITRVPGVVGLEAIDHRRGIGALSKPSIGATSGTLSGVYPGGTSGAGVSNDLQGYISSGLTVGWNAGHFGVDRGGGSFYVGMAYNTITTTLDAGDATNPRYDLAVMRVRDPGVTGESGITESAKIVIIKGAPAATPTIPTGSMTNGDAPLTAFRVGAGSNSSTITEVVDLRLGIVARGGITPKFPADTRNGAYEGEYRDDPDSDTLQRWTGTAWGAVASSAPWVSFTPKLYSEGGGECNLGSSGTAVGAYQLVGKNLKVRYLFQAVRPCNLGYGSIYTLLPAGLVSATAAGDFHGRAQLNTQPPGGSYNEWPGDAAMFGNSNRVYPKFNKTSTDNTIGQYRVASSAGQAGTGIPLISGEYPDPLRGLGLNIELEVQ